MGIQVLGTDKALRLNDATLLGMVQTESWQPNFNAQDVMEMGRDTKVDSSMELETSGSFELLATGNLAGMLARMQVQRTAGAFTGYAYDPTGGGGKNGYTLTQTDMREMEFDLLIHEKIDQVTFNRSVWLPRCFLTSFAGKVDTQGNATSTIQWEGQDVVGFPAPYHDLRSLPATYTSTTTITLSDVTVGSATHTLVYVYIDEKRFRSTVGDATHFALGVAGVLTMTTSEGYVIPPTAIMRVAVYKTTPGTVFPLLDVSDRGTSAFYVKGYQANVFIAPAVVTAPVKSEQWLRVQSVDYNVSLRVETLRQIAQNLAGSTIYCRVPTFPLDISLSASVYETDWADWKAVLTKTFAANVYDASFDWAPQNVKTSFAVVIQTYTKAGVLLETLRFTDMRMEGDSTTANVGGRGEMSWSMKGTAFTLIGTNG